MAKIHLYSIRSGPDEPEACQYRLRIDETDLDFGDCESVRIYTDVELKKLIRDLKKFKGYLP